MKEKRGKHLKLEWKYIGLSVLAGLLYYLVYYLKFPNSYNIIVSLALLALILKNFKSIEGTKIILYSMIISLVILPMTIFLMPLPLTYQLIILAINILLVLLVGYGLLKTKKWASVLAIITNLISAYTLVYSAVLVFKSVEFNIYLLLFMLKNVVSLAMIFAVIVYLLSFWKEFK